jgi:hypothetical protein
VPVLPGASRETVIGSLAASQQASLTAHCRELSPESSFSAELQSDLLRLAAGAQPSGALPQFALEVDPSAEPSLLLRDELRLELWARALARAARACTAESVPIGASP